MLAVPISRNQRQHHIDTWLRANATRVATEDANIIASALQSVGLFSAKTAIGDIRQSIRLRCQKFGLTFKGHERKTP